jgi:hypothetical protein
MVGYKNFERYKVDFHSVIYILILTFGIKNGMVNIYVGYRNGKRIQAYTNSDR